MSREGHRENEGSTKQTVAALPQTAAPTKRRPLVPGLSVLEAGALLVTVPRRRKKSQDSVAAKTKSRCHIAAKSIRQMHARRVWLESPIRLGKVPGARN